MLIGQDLIQNMLVYCTRELIIYLLFGGICSLSQLEDL